MDVIIPPAILSDLHGTSPNYDPLVLMGMHISPSYQARVNKGCMYAFGGLITRLCHAADIPNDSLDKWHQYFQHRRCHKDKWSQQLVNPNTHYRGVP